MGREKEGGRGAEWEQRASEALAASVATSAALRTRSKKGNHDVRLTWKSSGGQLQFA